MNTLEELNNYSNEQILTEDERPFAITYSDNVPDNVNVSVDEGQTHVLPFTVTVTDLVSVSNVYVYVEIDNDGSTVDPGITVDNFVQLDDWNWKKQIVTLDDIPTIDEVHPPFSAQDFGYTVTLSHPEYPVGSNITGYSWHVAVSVQDLSEWSALTAPINYGRGQLYSNVPGPFITDLENPNSTNYTVEIYASNLSALANITSSGESGATVDWNSSNANVYTIVGNKDEINSHLGNLDVWPDINFVDNFTLQFKQTGIGNLVTTVGQAWLYSQELSEWYVPISPVDYDEDFQVNPVPGYPQIADIENPNSTSYIVEIYASDSNAVANISSIGDSNATVDWDISNSNVYTISGTKLEVNDHLSNLAIWPGVDYDVDFTLYYKQTGAGNLITTTSQDWQIGALNSETSNLGIARSYVGNQINFVYANNVPQIIEQLPNSANYTVYLTLGANIGEIHDIGNSAGWFPGSLEYRFVGNADACNSMLSNIRFQPYVDVGANTTLRYRQYRDGILQTDDTVSYIGSAIISNAPVFFSWGYTDGGVKTFSFSNAHCTDYHFDVIAVGGGGAGGASKWVNTGVSSKGGGGGGGAVAYLLDTAIFANAANGSTTGNLTFSYQIGGGGNANVYAPNTFLQPGNGDPTNLWTSGYSYGDPRYFYLRAHGGGGGGWAWDQNHVTEYYIVGNSGGCGGGGPVSTWNIYANEYVGGNASNPIANPVTLSGNGYAGGNGDHPIAGGGGGAGGVGTAVVGGGAGPGLTLPFSPNLSGGNGSDTPYTYSPGGRNGKLGSTWTPNASFGGGGDGRSLASTDGSVFPDGLYPGDDGYDGVLVIRRYLGYEGPQ